MLSYHPLRIHCSPSNNDATRMIWKTMMSSRQFKGLCGASGKEVERVMTVMAADNTTASYHQDYQQGLSSFSFQWQLETPPLPSTRTTRPFLCNAGLLNIDALSKGSQCLLPVVFVSSQGFLFPPRGLSFTFSAHFLN